MEVLLQLTGGWDQKKKWRGNSFQTNGKMTKSYRVLGTGIIVLSFVSFLNFHLIQLEINPVDVPSEVELKRKKNPIDRKIHVTITLLAQSSFDSNRAKPCYLPRANRG